MNYTPKYLQSVISIESIYTAFIEEYAGNFIFPGESPEIWELDVILNGSMGITSGNNIYECHQGDLVIHAPNMFHTCWATDPRGVEAMTVSFAVSNGTSCVPSGKFICTPSEQGIIALLSELIHTAFNDQEPSETTLYPETEQIIKNLLEILCLSLRLRHTETVGTSKSRQAVLFSEIAGYMQTHVDDALNTQKLCNQFGIGQTALKNLFHNFTGAGVIRYYNHLRVQRIIALMSQGENLQSITLRMNFSSQSYLSDFFRRETGVPPSLYFSRVQKTSR